MDSIEETKECPYCGETIMASAKKCRYCDEWLEEVPDQSLSVPDQSLSAGVGERTEIIVPGDEQKVENLENTGYTEDAEITEDPQDSDKPILDIGDYKNTFLGFLLRLVSFIMVAAGLYIFLSYDDEEVSDYAFPLFFNFENIIVTVVLLLFYGKIKDTEAGQKFLKPMAIGIALNAWWLVSDITGIETSTFVDIVEYIIFLASYIGMMSAVIGYRPISIVARGLIIYPILELVSLILLNLNEIYFDFSENDIILIWLIYLIGIVSFLSYFAKFYDGKDFPIYQIILRVLKG